MGKAAKVGIGKVVEVVSDHGGMMAWRYKWVLMGLRRVGTVKKE